MRKVQKLPLTPHTLCTPCTLCANEPPGWNIHYLDNFCIIFWNTKTSSSCKFNCFVSLYNFNCKFEHLLFIWHCTYFQKIPTCHASCLTHHIFFVQKFLIPLWKVPQYVYICVSLNKSLYNCNVTLKLSTGCKQLCQRFHELHGTRQVFYPSYTVHNTTV